MPATSSPSSMGEDRRGTSASSGPANATAPMSANVAKLTELSFHPQFLVDSLESSATADEVCREQFTVPGQVFSVGAMTQSTSRIARVAVVAAVAGISGASGWPQHTHHPPPRVASSWTESADTLGPRPPPARLPTVATRTTSAPAAAAATYFPLSAIPKNLTVRAQQIPRRVLAAYVSAAKTIDRAQPGCHLRWYELAGIGYIESGHAHSGGSEAKHWNGVANPGIFGPLLDGSSGVSWHDTDSGRLDHNAQWERAVGPMQFMPTTWAVWGADGNRDRHEDPQQIDDATLAAAGYLCTGGGSSLDQIDHLIAAVYSYNHSYAYVRAVLTVAAQYAGLAPNALGVDKVPPDPGAKPSKSPSPSPSPSSSASPSKAPSTKPSPTTTSANTPAPPPAATPPTSPPATPTPAPTDSPTDSPSPGSTASTLPDPAAS